MVPPLEVFGDVFPLTDLRQQSIESAHCVSQGLLIGVRRSFQHLIEAIRCSLQSLQFFPCDRLLGPSPDGPN